MKKNIKEFNILEEKFKVLTETSPDCIKLFDIKGNLLYINPGGLEEHGLKSLDEALKKNWQAIETLIDEDKPKFKKALKDAIKGKVSTIEIRHTHGGANREVCLETIAPVKDAENKIIGIFGVSRDITEIKRNEKELQDIRENLEIKIRNRTEELEKSERLLKFAIEGGGISIWDWNVKSGEIILDDYWASILGYKPKEIKFNLDWWQSSIHPDDDIVFKKALNDYLKGKKEFYELEYRIKTKTGEWKWIWAQGKSIEWSNKNKPLRFLGVHLDITERKKVEHKLKEKIKEIENTNKLMVGRELKMVELKNKISKLEDKLKK